jgi:hypothetical protein
MMSTAEVGIALVLGGLVASRIALQAKGKMRVGMAVHTKLDSSFVWNARFVPTLSSLAMIAHDAITERRCL